MSEGKSQTESESLVDGNEMNQQVSNMADVFGSAGRRTYDDTQLEEFASIDEGKDQRYYINLYTFFPLQSEIKNIGVEHIGDN